MDNDPAICQALQSSMQDVLTEVHCMTSAVEALTNYIEQNYSLVILDMQLFDTNSMELLQTMRRAKRTSILVLTCPLCTEEIVGLFCAGADAYLTKPVNINICVAQAKALIQLYQDSDDKGKRHDLVTFGTELMIDPRYPRMTRSSSPATRPSRPTTPIRL